jgi:putative colanic acid biosysnthesis UDP-glucose lipid carrier transferase
MSLKRHWYRLIIVPLTLLSDGLSVLGAYGVSYWLRSLFPNALPELAVYLTLGVANSLSLWLVFWALGLYQPKQRESRFDENIYALLGLVLAVALILVGVFFVRSVSLSRLVIVYILPIAGLFMVLGRLLLRSFSDWARSHGYGVRQVMIIGTSALAQSAAQRLGLNPGLGYQVVGHIGNTTETPMTLLGELADLHQALTQYPVDEVWFALGEVPRQTLADLLAVVQQRPEVQIRFVPEVVELLTTTLVMDSLGGVPLLSLRETPLRRWFNRFLKRTLDIVLAGLGLCVVSPVLLLIALWVKLDSPGPIFYRQERMSRDGDSFFIYKFRSMRTDAEHAGPGWTTPNDQRVTRSGRLLRRTSLDELPQLLNVFFGDMSLVGPRPERPVYVEQFRQDIPKYFDRHLVKTGITGWAQIHGLRGDTSIPERVRFDLYYIENWSLLLDIRILLATVLQLFRGQYNAY